MVSGTADLRRRILTAVALLLSPALGAFAAHAAPMAVGLRTRWTMIDPTIYTAYSQHASDLLHRYGDFEYYWVRLGFIVPAAVSYRLFGAVPGFIIFRYALALLVVVSGYVLCRRVASRAAAWLYVSVVVTNPVILTAWGSDYPDSAAVSYLAAAAACLAIPVDEHRRRIATRVGGGVLLGLALNAHAATLPVAVALVIAVPLTGLGRERWNDIGVALLAALGIFAMFAVLAWILWGHGDIVTPTVRQYLRLQRPEQNAVWHSASWAWGQRMTYLVVPPFTVLAWLASLAARRAAVRPAERYLLAACCIGIALTLWSQARGGASLEYFLYSSLLWWSIGYLAAVVVWRLAGSRPGPMARWGPPALVVVITVAYSWLGVPVPRFGVWPTGLVAALVVLAVIAVLAWRSVRDPGTPEEGATPVSPRVVAGGAAVVVFLLAVSVFTVGQPTSNSTNARLASYPAADYGALGRLDTTRAQDVYRVVSEVPKTVPPATRPGDRVLTWVPPHPLPGPPLDPLDQGAAQYPVSQLSSGMPRLSPSDVSRLNQAAPGTCVLLLSVTGSEFPAAEAALSPWHTRAVARTVLTSGVVVLHVEVLQTGRGEPHDEARAGSSGRRKEFL